MKNILRENMRRFGTKNLAEQDGDSNNNGYPDSTESPIGAPLGADANRLGKLSQERLDSLIDELRFATDPDNEYYDYDGRDEDEIMSDIRLEFGNKIADQISDNNFHYPRHGWTPTKDALEDKEKSFQSSRITKGGKMHQQDINRRKNYYKRK